MAKNDYHLNNVRARSRQDDTYDDRFSLAYQRREIFIIMFESYVDRGIRNVIFILRSKNRPLLQKYLTQWPNRLMFLVKTLDQELWA